MCLASTISVILNYLKTPKCSTDCYKSSNYKTTAITQVNLFRKVVNIYLWIIHYYYYDNDFPENNLICSCSNRKIHEISSNRVPFLGKTIHTQLFEYISIKFLSILTGFVFVILINRFNNFSNMPSIVVDEETPKKRCNPHWEFTDWRQMKYYTHMSYMLNILCKCEDDTFSE